MISDCFKSITVKNKINIVRLLIAHSLINRMNEKLDGKFIDNIIWNNQLFADNG